MRLFVALLPPDDVLGELTRAAEPLKALPGAERLRWTQAGGRHLTLAFLGEVGEDLLPEIGERMARAAGRHRPLALRLSGGGRFGDRTLWVGVGGQTTDLGRLAGSVAAGARRCGIDVEERSFRAHLTLARARPGASLRPYARAMADFESRSWTAAGIELVRSHPPAPGLPGAQPRYEVLTTWALGG